jgi:mycothiol S-conjugate amidase
MRGTTNEGTAPVLRLLAVHAHPDDESSKGAATYAYYRSRGARVLVVTCTGGEAGDVLNPALPQPQTYRAERDMAALRRTEMAAARAAMGIEHLWLGYTDSGLPAEGESVRSDSFAAIPLEHSGAPLVRILREFRPHALVSYDENGGYPHPDHIRAHEVAVWAMRAAADPGAVPGTGEPWTVQKHYYDRIHSPARLEAIAGALAERNPDDPRIAELADMRSWRRGRPDPLVTSRVPCGEFFEVRDAALRSHASQVSADDGFFFWPNDIQRDVWPTEDFELVSSRVATTPPEDDLFAGISEEDVP